MELLLFIILQVLYAIYGWLDEKTETELNKIEARFQCFTIFEEWHERNKK